MERVRFSTGGPPATYWFGVLAAAGPTLERMTLPSGIAVDELDPGIRPQDDLFRHVNGRWLARTEIPADRARDSTFRILAEEAENAVREIVEEAASAPEGSEERKFGDLYASFMDADRAELLGSQPIGQTLAAARAVSSIPELLEMLGRLERVGIGGLYRLFVDTDPGNPERYLAGGTTPACGSTRRMSWPTCGRLVLSSSAGS
jgi:putative endopeptidase